MITDSYKISNAFNNFFVSIGTNFSSHIHSSIDPLAYVIPVQNSMHMSDLPENDVKNIILSLKNSAAGWDNFSTFMAKQCIDGYI